jgi:hypothetical protein
VATKAEIVADIAHEIGIATPRMSTGSTEPREIFSAIDQRYGLRIEENSLIESGRIPTKPDLARCIVTSAGLPWMPTFESSGGTVTRDGLTQVLRAVRFFRTGTTTDLES